MRKSSLPMWERGLKLVGKSFFHVSWVAPYVGAWIETSVRLRRF